MDGDPLGFLRGLDPLTAILVVSMLVTMLIVSVVQAVLWFLLPFYVRRIRLDIARLVQLNAELAGELARRPRRDPAFVDEGPPRLSAHKD